MKLLIKFPSRQRPDKFFKVLDLYYSMATNIDKIRFVITLDLDDRSMNNPEVITKLNTYRNLEYYFGTNKTKIEAVNADINDLEWDILLLASDDMIPIKQGYDQDIRNCMQADFPDLDGVLWFYDGHRADLNTLCILGRTYYQRFGYIYHPSYYSWYADEEFMYVSRMLGKESAYSDCIIEHQHHVWMHTGNDSLYKRNDNSSLVNRDKHNFFNRKAKGFPV